MRRIWIRRITNTLLEDNIIKTWAFVAYAYVVDVHVTPECGNFWIMSAEHFWVRVGNKCSKLRIRGTFLLVKTFVQKEVWCPNICWDIHTTFLFTHTVSVPRI